jgi:hypothetical protein
MNQETHDEAVKLPLWRECAKSMLEKGIEHGKVYPSSFFEEWLRCAPDSMHFSLGIAEIRRALEPHGFYLSGRGQKGEQYVILQPEAHGDVMMGYARKASDALRRGCILGTGTRLDLLKGEDRRRHESICEKMAVKFALVSRSSQVMKALPEQARKRLQKAS